MVTLSDRFYVAAQALSSQRAELLRELIRCKPLLGNEARAQEIMKSCMEDLGLRVDVWEPDEYEMRAQPAFCAYPGFEEMGFRNRPIVVGRLPGGGTGRSLILQGHVDVVTAEPEDEWSHDPWGGECIDGKIYGRGSTDMKAGLVAALSAVESLLQAGAKPGGDIIIQSVIDEEVMSIGALACALRGYKADAAIVAEPTALRILAAHAGLAHYRIRVEGRSAHAAQKLHGVCAIEKAMAVYRTFMDFEADRLARVVHPLFPNRPPVDTIIGKMNAGEWRSSVAGQAILEGRVGFAPGETVEQVEAMLIERLDALGQQDAWFKDHPPKLERLGYVASAEVSPGHPFVNLVQNVVASHGIDPTPGGLRAGCDMHRLVNEAGTPAIIWGPGNLEDAHTVDESVSLDHVDLATKMYMEAIVAWCGIEQ